MKVQDVLEDHDPNSPLFLYLAMPAPHRPLQVPQVNEHLSTKIYHKNLGYNFNLKLYYVEIH